MVFDWIQRFWEDLPNILGNLIEKVPLPRLIARTTEEVTRYFDVFARFAVGVNSVFYLFLELLRYLTQFQSTYRWKPLGISWLRFEIDLTYNRNAAESILNWVSSRAPGGERYVFWIEFIALAAWCFSYLFLRVLRDEVKFWTYGFNPEEISALSQWLLGDGELDDCDDVYSEPVPKEGSVFELICKFNFLAYRWGHFSMDREKLRERNHRLIAKYEHAFLAIYDSPRGIKSASKRIEPVAYTVILPLNEHGKEEYIDQKRLPDSAFTEHHLCKSGDKPCAVVFFGAAFDPKYPLYRRARGNPRLPEILRQCVQKHIRWLYSASSDGPPPAIYVQGESPRTRRIYENLGFEKTDKKSADGLWFHCIAHPFSRRLPATHINGRAEFDNQKAVFERDNNERS